MSCGYVVGVSVVVGVVCCMCGSRVQEFVEGGGMSCGDGNALRSSAVGPTGYGCCCRGAGTAVRGAGCCLSSHVVVCCLLLVRVCDESYPPIGMCRSCCALYRFLHRSCYSLSLPSDRPAGHSRHDSRGAHGGDYPNRV